MSHLVAPSVLSANFANLQADIEMINSSEADWFHVDVMDGVFVPNISFGFPVIKALKKLAKKPLDVHLMIEQPDRYLEDFRKAGASGLTVHYEACPHLHRTVQHIKELGALPGVALNPHTPVEVLSEILGDLSLVLIMSVNPGFGGQKFLPLTYTKIREAKDLINSAGTNTLIEIDGGVTLENAADIVKAGADVLVAGNTVFSAPNPAEMIKKLKAAIK